MYSRFVKRYACAIFGLAKEEGVVDVINEELLGLTSIDNIKGWSSIMDRHDVTFAQKKRWIEEIFGKAGIHVFVKNLLFMLAEKRRVFLLPSIAEEYKRLLIEARGGINVFVTVPDADTIREVERPLKEIVWLATKRDPVVRYVVDPSIIGGLVLKLDGRVYDYSVAGHLESVRMVLVESVLRFRREVL